MIFDDDRDGLVTQYFLFKTPVASVNNYFIPVSSVSNCVWIVGSITLCVTRGRCVLFVISGVVDCQII